MNYIPAEIFEHARRKKYAHFLRSYALNGKYEKYDQYKELIPSFREWYFKQRMEGVTDYTDIIIGFQNDVKPKLFLPYPQTYKKWINSWEEVVCKTLELNTSDDIIETANAERVALTSDEELRVGSKKLAKLLLADANETMKAVREEDDTLSSTAIRGKKHAVSVLNSMSKMTQGNRALELKEKADDRDSVGFFMDLIRQSKSGRMSPETLELLKQSNDKI